MENGPARIYASRTISQISEPVGWDRSCLASSQTGPAPGSLAAQVGTQFARCANIGNVGAVAPAERPVTRIALLPSAGMGALRVRYRPADDRCSDTGCDPQSGVAMTTVVAPVEVTPAPVEFPAEVPSTPTGATVGNLERSVRDGRGKNGTYRLAAGTRRRRR